MVFQKRRNRRVRCHRVKTPFSVFNPTQLFCKARPVTISLGGAVVKDGLPLHPDNGDIDRARSRLFEYGETGG
jgi:hypothetical protein